MRQLDDCSEGRNQGPCINCGEAVEFGVLYAARGNYYPRMVPLMRLGPSTGSAQVRVER